MTARAAEAVVKVEMPESRVQVIAPHQDNNTAAEPDAFRVSRRTIDGVLSFDEFVGFALAVLGGIGRSGGCRRLGLVLGAKIAALRNRSTNAEQQGKPGDGKTTENRFMESKQHSTHKVPDSCCPQAATLTRCQMPLKLVPNAAETPRIPMTDILEFVQQTRNLIGLW